MANRRRGEVEVLVEGRPVTLCLTLGALCELEHAFAVDDLGALAERFGTGRLSGRDLLRIATAGLRGGGLAVDEMEVAAMRFDGGLTALAAAIADLLAVTFGGDTGGTGTAEDTPPRPPPPPEAAGPPFPGTR